MQSKNISILALLIITISTCFISAEIGRKHLKNTNENNSSIINTIVKESWEYAKIIGGSILAAVTYGIGNDQVTARICPKYFTEGFHRNMLERGAWRGDKLAEHMLTETDPTKIGLFWGIAATWWVGATLGVFTAIASRTGSWPKLGVGDLAKPVGIEVAALYGIAATAGGYGYLASKNGWLSKDMKQNIRYAAGRTPEEAMHRYTADAFAHHAAYAAGAAIGLGIMVWAIYERYQRAQEGTNNQQSNPVYTDVYANPLEGTIGMKCTIEV